MNRWFVFLIMSCAWLLRAGAQVPSVAPLTVQAGGSVVISRPGVTAAYSMDSDTVLAEAVPEGFRITGKYPGEATVVLVTVAGAQPVRVTVVEPPHARNLRGGGSGQTFEYGHYEVRYNNSPNQVTGYEEVTQIAGNRQINVQLMNTDSAPEQGVAPMEFPMVSYQIEVPGRNLTLIDSMVDNTDLTMNQAMLRGVHLVNGPWEFHAGITSMTQYQGFLLPTQRVAIAGLSRHFQLNQRSSLEGNLYYFKPGRGAQAYATGGPLATAYYQYSHGRDFAATAELGIGDGLAIAARAERERANERLQGFFRYQSAKIAALSIYQPHGRMANFSWSDKLNRRLLASFNGSDTDVNLSQNKILVDTATLTPTYMITPHVGIMGGLTASRFLEMLPAQPGIRSAGFLVGPELTWTHAGGSFQIQQLKNTGNAPDSTNYNLTAQVSTAHVMASALFDAQSQSPVFAPVQSSTQPALQQLLLHESQMASSPQQMSEFVQQTASLSSQGYVQPMVILLAAQRKQYGVTVDASGDKIGHLLLQGMINASSGGNAPSVRLTMGSATWTRKLGFNNAVNAGFSLFRSTTDGQSQLQPVVQFSFQHQLSTVPRWIVPGRRGSIEGHVFVDNAYAQVYRRGAEPLSGVLVYLDGRRTTRSDKNGYYVFHGIPWGTHSVQVDYHDSRAFFYTSSSPREVPSGGTADFGISFAKGRIFGKVFSDAETGLAMTLEIQGRGIDRQVKTDGDGNVEIDGLPNGTYTVHPDDSSLPPGYSLADLNDQSVAVTAAKAGNFQFVIHAQRSISGSVQFVDAASGKRGPLAGVDVELTGTDRVAHTDDSGRYLFRQLPAGSHTVTVMFDGKSYSRIVQLNSAPDIESGVDIVISSSPSTMHNQEEQPVHVPQLH